MLIENCYFFGGRDGRSILGVYRSAPGPDERSMIEIDARTDSITELRDLTILSAEYGPALRRWPRVLRLLLWWERAFH